MQVGKQVVKPDEGVRTDFSKFISVSDEKVISFLVVDRNFVIKYVSPKLENKLSGFSGIMEGSRIEDWISMPWGNGVWWLDFITTFGLGVWGKLSGEPSLGAAIFSNIHVLEGKPHLFIRIHDKPEMPFKSSCQVVTTYLQQIWESTTPKYVSNSCGVIHLANPALQNLFQEKDWIGKKENQIWVQREGLDLNEIAGGKEGGGEQKENFKVNINGKFLQFRRGKVAFISENDGFLVELQDQTNEMKLKNQLSRAKKLSLLGRVAADNIHEFNNKLTVIGGNLRFLKKFFKPMPDVTEILAEVTKATDECTEMTRDLLRFSRVREEKRKSQNLNGLVESALRLTKGVIQGEIQLNLDLDADVPDLILDGDKIERMILNLLVNARDAMEGKGEIEVRTEFVTTGGNPHPLGGACGVGNFVRLKISDTGVGMDQEVQKNIFEPFFSTKGENSGTGLGLSIVKETVEQHGGEINIESEMGKGTTFNIDFIVDCNHCKLQSVAYGLKIMIISTDQTLSQMMGTIIKGGGMDVVHPDQIEKVLLQYQEQKLEIGGVIVDEEVKLEGYVSILEAILAINPKEQVILIGNEDDSKSIQGPKMRAAAFMSKPINLIEFEMALTRVFKDREV